MAIASRRLPEKAATIDRLLAKMREQAEQGASAPADSPARPEMAR